LKNTATTTKTPANFYKYLVFSVAPFFRQDGARGTRCLAVAVVADLVVAGMLPATNLTAGRRFLATLDWRVGDAGAAVAAQLVEGDVVADAALASVTQFGAPKFGPYIKLVLWKDWIFAKRASTG
jgi:hypothetical protein